MTVEPWLWLLAGFVLTLIGTGLARRYALRRQLLDHPDARRNHQTATARGGGIAILGTLLATAGMLAILHPAHTRTMVWMAASMLLVGGIGWWDDHRPLSAWLRLLVHLLAGLCLVAGGWGAGWPAWLLAAAVVLALVLINFWNFMDGIDGIAASQATVLALIIAAFCAGGWPAFFLALAGASSGFLAWNFPKARIFMGDVGSGLLGVTIAWGWAVATGATPLAGLLLLFPLAPFLVDPGLTLLLRIFRRERWWQAHSSHSYQIAARARGSHVPVTLAYLTVTGLGALLALVLKERGATFILPILGAWYIASAIMWRALRSPSKDRTDRSHA